jgi:Cft2 family RNA processing exonuclease
VDLQDLVENEIQDTPAVVIASSGMLLPGSASRRWAEALLNTPENWIVFTGHLIEDIREEVFDRGVINEHKWKKRPGYLNISGHASFQDTLAWVEQLAPKAVVLVHCGSDGAVDLAGPGSLAQALNHKGIPTIVARQGQPYIF